MLLNFEDSLELIITGDGSHTIFNKNLKEYYHSTFGAITESQCVFFDNGLSKYINQLPVISVLETGFGTGLNAFMAFLESEKYNQKIYFSGLEMFSLPISTIDDLNYTQHLNASNYKREFKALHDCAFEIEIKISNNFYFKKIAENIAKHKIKNEYNIIFFDAFAPEINEELWRIDVLQNMFDSLKKNGTLVTYCSKGVFKRNLKSVGFNVMNVPGPPGKREITLATKV